MRTKVTYILKNTVVFLAKAMAVVVFLLFMSGKVNNAYIGLKHIVADAWEAIR